VGAILAWIVWGLFIGALARLLTSGKHRIGLIWTVILGVAGSVAGGVVATKLLGIGELDDFGFPAFVFAVVFSVILLSIAARINRMLPDRSRDSS